MRIAALISFIVALPLLADPSHRIRTVSGTGVHYFTTSIVHSTTPTATGMIQRSTDIVELTGDLTGRILYHPVSVFDFVKQTLVNTGHQVFSGTILGSEPVLLFDDRFRFDVDLATGATTGRVYLLDRLAGPWIRCVLVVVGAVLTAEGNAAIHYTGNCTSSSWSASMYQSHPSQSRPVMADTARQ